MSSPLQPHTINFKFPLSMASRLKVLISAYGCEPGKGSEPGVGWQLATHMARLNDVWVITRANNKAAIEAELSKHPIDNLHFCYFDFPAWARFWKRGPRGVNLYYYLWQLGIRKLARQLHAQVGFDVVHHATFVKYWVPAGVAVVNAPFLWGPVGGADTPPLAFWPGLGCRGFVFEAARCLARWIGEHSPSLHFTARRAALALATTPATAARLKKLGTRKVELLIEAALPEQEVQALKKLPPPPSEPFRFVYLGNLLWLKGVHLAIHAFARCGLPKTELWLIGDGPYRAKLVNLAEKLGIAGNVRFFGKLPRQVALQRLSECHVYVHPSLHDSGGWACPEAMAAGKPVICLDIGGPAVEVTNECGFKIPLRSPEETIYLLAEAMRRLYLDSDLRLRMSAAAQKHVEKEFTWTKRVEQLNSYYHMIVNTQE